LLCIYNETDGYNYYLTTGGKPECAAQELFGPFDVDLFEWLQDGAEFNGTATIDGKLCDHFHLTDTAGVFDLYVLQLGRTCRCASATALRGTQICTTSIRTSRSSLRLPCLMCLSIVSITARNRAASRKTTAV